MRLLEISDKCFSSYRNIKLVVFLFKIDYHHDNVTILSYFRISFAIIVKIDTYKWLGVLTFYFAKTPRPPTHFSFLAGRMTKNKYRLANCLFLNYMVSAYKGSLFMLRMKSQKQSFAAVLQNKCFLKFYKLYGKTSVLESRFNKAAGLKACIFIKKRLQHMCFPVNFAKVLRTLIFKEHLRWLLKCKL